MRFSEKRDDLKIYFRPTEEGNGGIDYTRNNGVSPNIQIKDSARDLRTKMLSSDNWKNVRDIEKIGIPTANWLAPIGLDTKGLYKLDLLPSFQSGIVEWAGNSIEFREQLSSLAYSVGKLYERLKVLEVQVSKSSEPANSNNPAGPTPRLQPDLHNLSEVVDVASELNRLVDEGAIKNGSGVEDLRALITSQQGDVRAAAARALGVAAADQARPIIEEALAVESSKFVRAVLNGVLRSIA